MRTGDCVLGSDSRTVPSVDKGAFQRRREQLGATQTEMALALKVHQKTISKWERGVHEIPESVALLLERLKPADIKKLSNRRA